MLICDANVAPRHETSHTARGGFIQPSFCHWWPSRCEYGSLRSGAFDLAYVMNAPSNVDELRRVLRPGGVAVLAFTYGHHTPMYLDSAAAERFLRRAGFREIRSGRGGKGTYTLGRLPGE
jgi:hypothetical protein